MIYEMEKGWIKAELRDEFPSMRCFQKLKGLASGAVITAASRFGNRRLNQARIKSSW